MNDTWSLLWKRCRNDRQCFTVYCKEIQTEICSSNGTKKLRERIGHEHRTAAVSKLTLLYLARDSLEHLDGKQTDVLFAESCGLFHGTQLFRQLEQVLKQAHPIFKADATPEQESRTFEMLINVEHVLSKSIS